MLLTGLERGQRWLAVDILGYTNNTPWHLTLVFSERVAK